MELLRTHKLLAHDDSLADGWARALVGVSAEFVYSPILFGGCLLVDARLDPDQDKNFVNWFLAHDILARKYGEETSEGSLSAMFLADDFVPTHPMLFLPTYRAVEKFNQRDPRFGVAQVILGAPFFDLFTHWEWTQTKDIRYELDASKAERLV